MVLEFFVVSESVLVFVFVVVVVVVSVVVVVVEEKDPIQPMSRIDSISRSVMFP